MTEFTLKQTPARCKYIRPDNSDECSLHYGHQGFHRGRSGWWIDIQEIPRTWHHQTIDTFNTFWLHQAASI